MHVAQRAEGNGHINYFDAQVKQEADRLLDQHRNVFGPPLLRFLEAQGVISVDSLGDFGAGAGAALVVWGKIAKAITVVEQNQKMEDVLAYTADQAGCSDRVTAHICRIEDAAVPVESLDVVVMDKVLQHNGSDVRIELVQKARQSLRDGGHLLIVELNVPTWNIDPSTSEFEALRAGFVQVYKNKHNEAEMGPKVHALLKKNGFEIVAEPTPKGVTSEGGKLGMRAHIGILKTAKADMTAETINGCPQIMKPGDFDGFMGAFEKHLNDPSTRATTPNVHLVYAKKA